MWCNGQRDWGRTALRAWRWKRGAGEDFEKPKCQKNCSSASMAKEQTLSSASFTEGVQGFYTLFAVVRKSDHSIIYSNIFLFYFPLLQAQSIAYFCPKNKNKIRNLLLCLQSWATCSEELSPGGFSHLCLRHHFVWDLILISPRQTLMKLNLLFQHPQLSWYLESRFCWFSTCWINGDLILGFQKIRSV